MQSKRNRTLSGHSQRSQGGEENGMHRRSNSIASKRGGRSGQVKGSFYNKNKLINIGNIQGGQSQSKLKVVN